MPKPKKKLVVFLSHANEDKPKVRKLFNRLKYDGFDPWLDEERILPGQDWRLETERALRTSDAIILCFSKKSLVKEGYIQREYKGALDYQQEKPEGTIFVIPVRLDDCEIPFFLRELQCVDYPAGYEKLVLSLKVRAVNSVSKINPLTLSISNPIAVKDGTSKETFNQVQLVLEGEFVDFNETRQEDLKLVLASLLRIDSESIRILQVYSGSIIVNIEIPEIAANRLRESATNRDYRLIGLKIISIQIADEQVILLSSVNRNSQDETLSLGADSIAQYLPILQGYFRSDPHSIEIRKQLLKKYNKQAESDSDIEISDIETVRGRAEKLYARLKPIKEIVQNYNNLMEIIRQHGIHSTSELDNYEQQFRSIHVYATQLRHERSSDQDGNVLDEVIQAIGIHLKQIDDIRRDIHEQEKIKYLVEEFNSLVSYYKVNPIRTYSQAQEAKNRIKRIQNISYELRENIASGSDMNKVLDQIDDTLRNILIQLRG